MSAVGTITDAVIRVVMAYTMPAYELPGLGTGLVLVTSMVLIVVTNVYYIVCGVFDRSSRLPGPRANSPARRDDPRDQRWRILTRQPRRQDG